MKRAAEGSKRRLILVNKAGRVQMASDDVWPLLAKYFDMPRTHGFLPDVLRNWARYERSCLHEGSDVPAPSVPLVVSKECGKITMHFLWGKRDSDQDVIIVEEDRVDVSSTWIYTSRLTKRETEVLSWLAQGKTNAEIGLALSISPRTVKKHLEHIYDKLHVHRRSVVAARSSGL
jgi:DNA-binding CsgD family transcriptional regulator